MFFALSLVVVYIRIDIEDASRKGLSGSEMLVYYGLCTLCRGGSRRLSHSEIALFSHCGHRNTARRMVESLVAKGLIVCTNSEYSVPDNPCGKKLLQDPAAGAQNEQVGAQNEQVGAQNEQVCAQNEQVSAQNEQNLKESSKENINNNRGGELNNNNSYPPAPEFFGKKFINGNGGVGVVIKRPRTKHQGG